MSRRRSRCRTGIVVTLRMFQHQFKHGVQVTRQFDQSLPRIRANGSALNQIWTNHIDDALDAMESFPPEQPKALRVKTYGERDGILVEILTTVQVFPLMCKTACLSRSSRPNLWAKERGLDSTSFNASFVATGINPR